MAERKKISARKKISVSEQEKLIDALKEKDSAQQHDPIQPDKQKGSTKMQRVTVDFPQNMYDQMKAETKMNGQTLRGFVLALVRKHFSEKEE